MKKIIIAIIIVVAGLVGWFGKDWLDKNKSENPSPTPTLAAISDNQAYAWQFDDAGADSDTGAPKTKVSLIIVDSEVVPLGVYQGLCADATNSAWPLLKDEIASAICWFAGGGKEIGVFKENGKTVIKVGDLDEGSQEAPAVRGNFTVLKEF